MLRGTPAKVSVRTGRREPEGSLTGLFRSRLEIRETLPLRFDEDERAGQSLWRV